MANLYLSSNQVEIILAQIEKGWVDRWILWDGFAEHQTSKHQLSLHYGTDVMFEPFSFEMSLIIR